MIPTLGCIRRVRSYSNAILSLPLDQPLASTNPFLPNLPTTPFRNPSLLSISPSPNPFSSLSTKICLIVTTSRNCLPSLPFLPILLNSSSASSANLYLAVNKDTAGFCFAFGKTDCEGAEADGWKWEAGWLKVEELDWVGLGWTGPSWERRAARPRSASSSTRCIILAFCSLGSKSNNCFA